ncbi:hypothetical protein C0J52_17408 [Blattella germanica]|nr:hypothetical protein C0J52_17408 [Blattella germanica]
MAKRADSCGSCGPPDFQAQLLTSLRDKNFITFTNLLQEYDADGERLVDPDHQYGDPDHASCLDMACSDNESEDYITALLNAGANPNRVNPVRKKAAIHITTEQGNFKAISALLQEKITDVNIQDNYGNTALHLSAKFYSKNPSNMEKCIAILMSQTDIKINKKNIKGLTAIHEAVLAKCRPAIETILKYGNSKVFLENTDRQSNKTIRKLIEDEYKDLELPPPATDEKNQEEFYLNAYTSDMKTSSNKKSLKDADEGKFTYLQYACFHGLYEISEYLLRNEADPNATIPTNRKPPIFYACSGGYFEIMSLLLQYKAEVATVEGKTLLHAVPPTSEGSAHYVQNQNNAEKGGDHLTQTLIPELYPLHYISKSHDLRPLLTHPVLLRFLHLKWSHIRVFFYANLLFYTLFVAVLTSHVMRNCSNMSYAQNITDQFIISNTSTSVRIEWIVLAILLSILVLRETFQMIMSPRRYFCSFEICLELFLIIVTIIILSKDWANPCLKPIDALAILFSWSEL